MWKRIRRLLGRPKTGQKYYPHSLSLTLAQKAFLDKQPNASELVRKILNDLITVQGEIEPEINGKINVISLKRQIDLLEEQASKAYSEWINYAMKCREKGEINNAITECGTVWDEKAKSYIPATPSTPTENFHLTVLSALKTQYDRTRAKIKELQEKVIEIVNLTNK
jgi:hypothetical protein